MHLPSGTAVYTGSTAGGGGGVLGGAATMITSSGSPTDWSTPISVYKQQHSICEATPASNISTGSNSPTGGASNGSTGNNSSSNNNNNNNNNAIHQDLWWTERLVMEAQQEFPGELGKFY